MKTYRTLFIGMCILLLCACGNGRENNKAKEDVPMVRVDSAKAVGCGSVLQFPGRVVAATDANLSFKVAGTLRRVCVNEGSYVRKGQLIAELDDADYQLQLNATKAEYAGVKADAERVMALYKEGGTTASNYDKARYGLEQMEAKLTNHTNQYNYTRLYAPYDGCVQRQFFEVGETVGPGMPIISLLANVAPEIEVNLPASSYVNRNHFTGYGCTLDILPGEMLSLDLVSVLPQANANQLYTMRLRLRDNNEQVAPGMSAWVSIQVNDSISEGVRIPATALVREGEQTYVYVYEGKSETVKRINVQVNRLHTNGTADVSGNIVAGDRVVGTGAHHIHDGQHVRLMAPVSKTNVGGLL